MCEIDRWRFSFREQTAKETTSERIVFTVGIWTRTRARVNLECFFMWVTTEKNVVHLLWSWESLFFMAWRQAHICSRRIDVTVRLIHTYVTKLSRFLMEVGKRCRNYWILLPLLYNNSYNFPTTSLVARDAYYSCAAIYDNRVSTI